MAGDYRDEFTKENIRLVVAGLCKLMLLEGHAGKEICVGYDRRFLSKESAHWAAEVLAGYGFHVFVVARSSPTPLIMFTVKQMQTPTVWPSPPATTPRSTTASRFFTAGGRDADQVVTGKIRGADCPSQAGGREVHRLRSGHGNGSDPGRLSLQRVHRQHSRRSLTPRRSSAPTCASPSTPCMASARAASGPFC